jgi:hypothetical protein
MVVTVSYDGISPKWARPHPALHQSFFLHLSKGSSQPSVLFAASAELYHASSFAIIGNGAVRRIMLFLCVDEH